MATKMRTVCDMHDIATGEEVEAEAIDPITLPSGKQKVLDICPDCRGVITYNALIELAEEVGRDPQRRTSRATPEKEKREIPEHLRETCRVEGCGRNDFKRQGRLMHERRAHPEEFARMEEEERQRQEASSTSHHCDTCDTTLHGDRSWNRHLESATHKRNSEALQPA